MSKSLRESKLSILTVPVIFRGKFSPVIIRSVEISVDISSRISDFNAAKFHFVSFNIKNRI